MTIPRIKRKIVYLWFAAVRRIKSNSFKVVVKACLTIILVLLILNYFNKWFENQGFVKYSTLNLYLFLSAIFLAGIGLLDNTNSFLQSRGFKFVIIFIACDIAYVASDKKDVQNDKEKVELQRKDSSFRAFTAITDSIKNERRSKLFQDSLQRRTEWMANVFNSAFGKDQKKYIEARNEIASLIKSDTAKEIKYYSQGRPILDFNNIVLTKMTQDSIFLQLKLEAKQSTAYDLHLVAKIGFIMNNNRIKFIRYPFDNLDYNNGEQLEGGKTRTAKLNLPMFPGTNDVVVNLKGYYTDYIDREQKIPYDKILLYDIQDKKIVALVDESLKKVRIQFNRY